MALLPELPLQLRYTEALAKWEKLVEGNLDEHAYQKFLRIHAGLFLATSLHDGVVLSKVKLGAEFETDFVVVTDRFSAGLGYRFIELEIPQDKLFTKRSKPTNRLNTALAQVDSWKQWLLTHPVEASERFPSAGNSVGFPSNYDFEILIGRRFGENSWQSKDRAWISETHGVSIRSFDSLTSSASLNRWHSVGRSQTLNGHPESMEATLSRSDWSALSHQAWADFRLKGLTRNLHLLGNNWREILASRIWWPE